MKKKIVFLFVFLLFSVFNSYALTVVYRGCDGGVGSYDFYDGGTYVGSGKGACCGIKVGGKGKEVMKFSKDSEIGKKLLALDSKIDLNKVSVYGSKQNTVKPKQN